MKEAIVTEAKAAVNTAVAAAVAYAAVHVPADVFNLADDRTALIGAATAAVVAAAHQVGHVLTKLQAS